MVSLVRLVRFMARFFYPVRPGISEAPRVNLGDGKHGTPAAGATETSAIVQRVMPDEGGGAQLACWSD